MHICTNMYEYQQYIIGMSTCVQSTYYLKFIYFGTTCTSATALLLLYGGGFESWRDAGSSRFRCLIWIDRLFFHEGPIRGGMLLCTSFEHCNGRP